jgi:hypothetical protein
MKLARLCCRKDKVDADVAESGARWTAGTGRFANPQFNSPRRSPLADRLNALGSPEQIPSASVPRNSQLQSEILLPGRRAALSPCFQEIQRCEGHRHVEYCPPSFGKSSSRDLAGREMNPSMNCESVSCWAVALNLERPRLESRRGRLLSHPVCMAKVKHAVLTDAHSI